MSDAKWLVKSSGRLLGPWTIEAIIEQIKSRNISILDEVKDPLNRWLFIREHQLLTSAVRQVRDEQSNVIENTQSTFVTSGRTITSSVTERLVQEGELTPNPTPGMVSVAGTEKTVNSGPLGQNAFGVLTDNRARQQVDKSVGSWMWFVYGAGVLAFVGALLFLRSQSGSKMSNEQAEETFKVANELALRGEYQKSVDLVEKMANSRNLRPAENVLKVKLLLALESPAEIEIMQIIDTLRIAPPSDGMNVELLRGLVQSRLGKWREAQASYQSALEKNSMGEEVRLNLASSFFSNSEFAKAWSYLRPPRGAQLKAFYQILKSMVVLSWDDPKTRAGVMESAYNEFRDFDRFDDKDRSRTAGRDFRFERLVLLATLASKAGKPEAAQEIRTRLLQTNPMESRYYVRSPLLDWAAVGWTSVLSKCQALRDAGRSDDPVNRGVWALCLAGAGDLVNSRNYLDEALKQFQGDKTLVGVDALLLFASGRKAEAERVTAMHPNSDQALITWVQALACEEKLDSSCAERVWEQLKGLDQHEPRAYYGIARVAKDLGNDSRYFSSSSQGLRYAPNYRPLLQLTGGRHEF